MTRPGWDDPHWYQRAVFYEVFLRGFADSSGDGTGDLRGLTERLDHLDWLGVDCLWLLPFYASPLRDGGYDIADFFTVHPSYGVLADVVELIEEAHKRGIRVIADLVVNHTSDQHPWFQESRQDRTNPRPTGTCGTTTTSAGPRRGSSSTTPSARTGRGTHVRGSTSGIGSSRHQPDLNYRNPDVGNALFDVVRYWLDLGLDGFRLDAVPFLFEADGTNGENLPETYDFLRQLRASVDSSHPGRFLLAEANQWPSEVMPYFGEGDSCHMCFHFPLMPRMYLAAKRGERTPIESILDRDAGAARGLPVGAVPPQPRRADARDGDRRRARRAVRRVRRRPDDAPEHRHRSPAGPAAPQQPPADGAVLLAALHAAGQPDPLLRRRDRHGRQRPPRRPRQRAHARCSGRGDRNAGFSPAASEALYLPVISDPVYGYQAVNVESQRQNGGSLLRWMSHILSVRRDHPQLALGSFTMLDVDNPAVFAYIRGGVPEAPEPDPVRRQPPPPGPAGRDPAAGPHRRPARSSCSATSRSRRSARTPTRSRWPPRASWPSSCHEEEATAG